MQIRDFIGIIRDLSFSEIRHEAMIPPRLLLVAQTNEQGYAWRAMLFGDDVADFVEVAERTSGHVDPLAYDAIVSVGPLDPQIGRAWSDLFRRANQEMLLIEVDTNHVSDEKQLERVRRRICDLARDRSVAIGRYIDRMRASAGAEVIADTSRVNAQFAAVSNIPALVPVVGTILAAGADFLVLTKNQLMMMYRLAAIYNRDLENRWRIYSELMPVVGAGLLWRTTARQIAALVPFALGAVPKVTIAYAGTYAVGQAARVYFESGERLNREDFQELYKEAIGILGRARLRRRDKDAIPEGEASAIPLPDASKRLSE